MKLDYLDLLKIKEEVEIREVRRLQRLLDVDLNEVEMESLHGDWGDKD